MTDITGSTIYKNTWEIQAMVDEFEKKVSMLDSDHNQLVKNIDNELDKQNTNRDSLARTVIHTKLDFIRMPKWKQEWYLGQR